MVSVVIPTHNRADLLPKAVASVQNQTVKDLEIIVVSDGSTDDTSKVMTAMAKEDPRIKFIEYHPAKGGNNARNTGIDHAQGEFVAFLDDDDEWLPEKLEKQLAVMASDPEIGLVYTGVKLIFLAEDISYCSKARVSGDLSREILLTNNIGTTSTVMVRRELFSKTGKFDVNLKAQQDYDLWIRFCQHCKIGCVPEEMLNYYNYPGGQQISAWTGKYVESSAYINEKYKDLLAALTPEEYRTKQYNENLNMASKAMRNNEGKLARQYITKALKLRVSTKALGYYALSFLQYKTVLKIRSKV